MSADLPPIGISASRIEQLRETILAKIEALVNELDIEGDEEIVAQAEAINQLTEAFMNLR